MEKFFSNVHIPKLSENEAKIFTENLTEKVSQNFSKSMQRGKSPGKHELIKKFMKYYGLNCRKYLYILYQKPNKKAF